MRISGVIQNDIAVRDAGEIGVGNGIDGFPTWLEGLPGIDAKKQITSVCILADGDSNPVAQFQKIVGMLNAANNKPDTINEYSIPNAVGQRATNGRLATTIWFFPDGQSTGCLETLLKPVLRANYPPQMLCVDAFLQCAQTNNWSANKQDKAFVSAAIACILEDDPFCPLSRLWDRHPTLIPVTSPVFAPLAAQLNQI